MLRKKIIKLISKVLIISSIVLALLMPLNPCCASANKRILIYHSHTAESYCDGYDVVKGGEDLSNKLRKKGYTVHHIIDKFDTDYKNSYYNSNRMLKEKDLSKYDLIIDYHRDSINKKITSKDKNGNEIAKTMFVLTKEQDNYFSQKATVNKIEKELATISSSDMVRKTWEYKKGITYYSQNLSENIILLENGFNTNTELEVKRSNTYLSYSIDKILNK